MPNKKIFVILIICVGVVASVMIYEWGIGVRPVKANARDITVSNSANIQDVNLKNWQAVLSNISSTTVITKNEVNLTEMDETLTGQITRDFFGQYLVLTQNGTRITNVEADQIVKNALSLANLNDLNIKKYSEKDLIINEQTNKQIVKKYDSDLNLSIKKRMTVEKKEEIAILMSIINEDDNDYTSKLNLIIKNYNTLIQDLLKISVPKDAVTPHLNLVNSLSKTLEYIKMIQDSKKDPIKSIFGLKQYIDQLKETLMVTEILNKYIEIKLN